MKTLVQYHANCSDGFGAAYAAWKHFGDDAVYVPLQHGGANVDVGGFDQVFFLDAVPLAELDAIVEQVGKVVIIDHHKSTMNRLGVSVGQTNKGPMEIHFSMVHSAAHLTWKYFSPAVPVPWVIDYVEDFDLWLHKLPLSREVNAAIRSYPFDFLDWDAFPVPTKMAQVGEHVLRTEKIYWERALKNVQWLVLGGLKVPIVNTTVGVSEACNALLERLHVPVAGYYFDRGDGIRQWGLRSDGTVDVSEIAGKLGGGGHQKAAGFETSLRGIE